MIGGRVRSTPRGVEQDMQLYGVGDTLKQLHHRHHQRSCTTDTVDAPATSLPYSQLLR